MAVNYSKWSVAKLKKEIVKIEKAIATQDKRQKKSVLAELEALAQKSGYKLQELVGGGGSPRTKKVRKARGTASKTAKRRSKRSYQNPKDSEQVWSGLGRRPAWVNLHLRKGGALDDLAV